MIVGLTGGIGSGKTTVANFFSEFDDVAVYIADYEAKKLMNTSIEIKEKLIIEFGERSFLNNELNRKYISDIVFKPVTIFFNSSPAPLTASIPFLTRFSSQLKTNQPSVCSMPPIELNASPTTVKDLVIAVCTSSQFTSDLTNLSNSVNSVSAVMKL